MKPNQPKPPRSLGDRTIDLRKHRPEQSSHKPYVAPQPRFKDQRQYKKRRPIKYILLSVAALMVLGAMYLFFLLQSPLAFRLSEKELIEKSKTVQDDRLIIPKIGVDSPIFDGGVEQLERGLWHRQPPYGNPQIGHNFVLTGHSFVWGYTPKQIKEKSIFYYLADLREGDEIIAHWKGQAYTYKVAEKKTVKPNDTEVERDTTSPILTLYTCTLGGSADGRVVIVAKP